MTHTPITLKRLEEIVRQHFYPGPVAGSTERLCKALNDEIAQALTGAGEPVGYVPENCTDAVFVMESASVNFRKNGSATILVDEDRFELEDDRCEGLDGPEGGVYWRAEISAHDVQNLRYLLNNARFPQTPTPDPAPNREAVAKAIYEQNPYQDQETDLDGRPISKPYTVAFDDLIEYDSGIYESMLKTADAVLALFCGSSANNKTVCRSDSGGNDHQTDPDTVTVRREDLEWAVEDSKRALYPMSTPYIDRLSQALQVKP